MGTEVRVFGLGWGRKESRTGLVRVVARVSALGVSAGFLEGRLVNLIN